MNMILTVPKFVVGKYFLSIFVASVGLIINHFLEKKLIYMTFCREWNVLLDISVIWIKNCASVFLCCELCAVFHRNTMPRFPPYPQAKNSIDLLVSSHMFPPGWLKGQLHTGKPSNYVYKLIQPVEMNQKWTKAVN